MSQQLPPPPPLPSGTNNSDLYPVLFHIYERLGTLTTAVNQHEKHDEERHDSISKRLEKVEDKLGIVEQADITGRHDIARLDAEIAKRKAANATWKEWGFRALLLVLGAFLSLGGGALSSSCKTAQAAKAPISAK